MALTSRPPAPSMSGLRLPGYGYLNDIPVYRDPVDIPRVQQPQRQTPDLVKVQFGAGDKGIVGSLLRAANGEESGLTGVPPEYAAKLLTQWGYPTSMDALSADEWEQRISANAMQINPLDLLGGY